MRLAETRERAAGLEREREVARAVETGTLAPLVLYEFKFVARLQIE